jgi:hypothetical protein
VLALLAWPAPGALAVTLIGGATGCASFAATCRPPADLLPVVAGTLLFALLVALRPLARLSAVGTVGAALLAFPIAVLGVDRGAVDGAPGDASRAIAMLAAVWLAAALAALLVSRGRILRG